MKLTKKSLFLPVVALLTCLLFIQGTSLKKTSALTGSEFEAGYIIDDAVFYDRSTMTPDQIQAFFNAKVPNCDTNGTQIYSGSTTRAQYGASRGYPAPYTCLKDYVQMTTNKSPESGLCNGHTAGNKSAAMIVHEVAQSCGINPQVLIVLLQKEQSLVTDDWPWSVQYRSATGYGCPDTAPCDEQYYGFFNQVYEAARAFKRYALNPTNYNYRYGRNNYILYNPNTSCGGSNVYIQNQATASLYIYTPYQPNTSALNNLYGSGDSCGAYGNRNFWRMFNDWFGSTRGSYLLRSVQDATVYMVVDGNKYPIADLAILGALYPLGPVKYVSQDYLNQKTTGQTVGRLIRDEGGTIYFHDAGIKLGFTSCGQVAHYGYTCGDYINLTDPMMQKLVTGPVMTQVFGTTSGKNFYIENGTKKEIYDSVAKAAANITVSANTLNESAINYLPYAAPVLRNDSLILTRGAADVYLYQLSAKHPITGSVYAETALANNLPKAYLDSASINFVSNGSLLNGLVRNGSNTQHFILDRFGKASVATPSEWSGSFITFSDTVLASFSDSSQQPSSKLVKSPSNGTIYYIENGMKRPIHEWDDLVRLKVNPFIINTISSTTIDTIPTGNRIIGPGKLVKYSNNATVYIVEGTTQIAPISTFQVPANLTSATTISTLPDSVLDAYTKKASNQGIVVSCNAKNFIASNGYLYEVSAGMQTHYQLSYQATDNKLCDNSRGISNPLDRYIIVPGGTIYYIESGTKRPIVGYAKYLELGGNASNTISLSEYSASMIPTGALLN